MEKHTEMKVIRVNKFCDECKDEELKHTGMVQMTNPVKYPHTCLRCGNEYVFNDRYPKIEYIEKQL